MASKFEFIINIILILSLMGAGLPLWRLISGFSYKPNEGDALQRNILLVGYILALLPIILYPKRFRVLVFSVPLIWLLITWAALSIFWSGSPSLALRRIIAILLTTSYALVLYMRFPFASFLRLLGLAFFIAIFISILIAVIKPEWGTTYYDQTSVWRGVFDHKNTFGKVSSISFLFFTHLWSLNKKLRDRFFWGSAIILSIIAIIKSNSVTALVTSIIIATGTMLIKISRPWQKVWQFFILFIVLIGIGVGLLVIQNNEILFDILGREVTLTGRTELWRLLIPMGFKRLWIGYGFRTFWLGWDGPSANIYSLLRWMPTHGHNGFLDTFLELGLIGLGMGIVLIVKTLFANLRSAFFGSVEGRFWVLFCLSFITYNFAESELLRINSILWVMLVYAYLSVKLKRSNFSHIVVKKGSDINYDTLHLA